MGTGIDAVHVATIERGAINANEGNRWCKCGICMCEERSVRKATADLSHRFAVHASNQGVDAFA